jgi:LysM repeat protein
VISTTVASAAVTPNPTARSSPIGNVEAYEVEFGDTLGIISERFDVPIEELMRVNQLDDPNSLSVGMVLYIPVTPKRSDPDACLTQSTPPTSTALPPPAARSPFDYKRRDRHRRPGLGACLYHPHR